MAGQNTKLAQEVERVLIAHGKPGRRLSLRQAELRTQVSYSTVENMAAGKPNIKPENLVRFAVGFGEDPKHWLELCGYDPEWHDPYNGKRDIDPDVAEMIELFLRIPQDKRPFIKSALASICAALV